MTVKTDEKKQKLIVDTGSPVEKKPLDQKISEDKEILPLTRKYQEINRNGVISAGKITVEAESTAL